MRSLKVLYVDDEEDLRDLARLALEMDGDMAVQIADSGEAALQTLADTNFDAILLDYMMPGIDGLTVMTRLQNLPANTTTPVIFVTARTQGDLHQTLLARGVLAVITKPYDPFSLAQRVRNALGD